MHKPLVLLGIIVLLVAAGCGESVPRIEITEATDGENGTVTLKYNAKEFSGNDIDITAHYTIGSTAMASATAKGGDGTENITTSSDGTAHTFVWDYKTDLGVGRHRGITFSIVPYGPDGRGRTGVVGPLEVGLPLLYTANEGADSVSIVDISAGQVSSTATVGAGPRGIAALPDESKLYVTNADGSTVSIVDIDDPTIVSSLAVGASPTGIAVSSDGTRVFVVNSADGTVSVIDSSATTPSVVDTYTVGTSPAACSLTANGETLFVTNSGDNTVSILLAADGSALVSPLAVGNNPQGVASGSRYTVVCNFDSGTVSVIDGTAIGSTVPQVAVDSEPVAVVVDEFDAFAYVANSGSDSISVVNLEVLSVVGTVDLSGGTSKGPWALTLDSEGEYLYATYRITSQVAKIDLGELSVLTTYSVGTNPVGIAILAK